MQKILKSFYYGLISALPAFILGGALCVLFFSTHMFTPSLKTIELYNEMQTFKPLASLIGKDFTIIYNSLKALFIISYIFFVLTFLKMINPSFKLKNLEGKKQYFLIAFKFILVFGAVLLLSIFLDNILSFIDIKAISTAISLLIVACLWTLVILYWHIDGCIGNFSSYRQRPTVKKGIKQLQLNKLAIFLKVLLTVIVLSAVANISSALIIKDFKYSSIIVADSVSIYLKVFYNFLFMFSLASFVFLPLFYSLVGSLKQNSKGLFLKLIPVIIVVVFLVGNLIQTEIALGAIDYYKDLPQKTEVEFNKSRSRNYDDMEDILANINKDNKSERDNNYNTKIVLTDKPKVSYDKAYSHWSFASPDRNKDRLQSYFLFPIYNLYAQVDSSFLSLYNSSVFPNVDKKVPCTDNNIAEVKQLAPYLKNKDYRSVLASEYFSALESCYRENWQTDKFTRINRIGFNKKPVFLWGVNYFSDRTIWADHDQDQINSFQDFVEKAEKKYYLEKVEDNIARKFLHYNKHEQAKKWFKKAEKDLDEIEFKNGFTQGNVWGKIDINNKDLKDGIRVGLLKKDKEEHEKNFGLYLGDEVSMYLVASTGLNSQREFKFNNLIAGDYYLGVLIKENKFEKEDVQINGATGKISIGWDNPAYNVGELDIEINK